MKVTAWSNKCGYNVEAPELGVVHAEVWHFNPKITGVRIGTEADEFHRYFDKFLTIPSPLVDPASAVRLCVEHGVECGVKTWDANHGLLDKKYLQLTLL